MEIAKLEKAVRLAAQGDYAQSILAAPESKSQGDLDLPSEFDEATKTLARRRHKKSVGPISVLSTATSVWAVWA